MSTYCSPLQPYPGATACSEFFLGGLRHAIVFDEAPADPTSEAEIQALIVAGKATLVSDVMISIEAPSATTVDRRVSCAPPAVINYERTAQWQDERATPEVAEFYKSVNGTTGFLAKALMLYECSNGRVQYIESNISFAGGLITPGQDDDLIRWEFELSWKSPQDPVIYETPPAGIFP